MAQTLKNLPAMQETRVLSWVRKIRWRRKWLPIPVFLPGESHGTEEPGRLQSMGWESVEHPEQHTQSVEGASETLC